MFPLALTWRRRIVVDVNALPYLTASANFNQRCQLLNVCDGRRSVPPAMGDDVGEAVNRNTVCISAGNVVVGFVHQGGIERVKIHIAIFGCRAVIVRVATRALNALRASLI